MADIKYYDVIKKPVITEKSMNAMAEKKYTFLVHPEANKSQIKEAVEKMFEGTKVKSVNTMNMDGRSENHVAPLFARCVCGIVRQPPGSFRNRAGIVRYSVFDNRKSV